MRPPSRRICLFDCVQDPNGRSMGVKGRRSNVVDGNRSATRVQPRRRRRYLSILADTPLRVLADQLPVDEGLARLLAGPAQEAMADLLDDHVVHLVLADREVEPCGAPSIANSTGRLCSTTSTSSTVMRTRPKSWPQWNATRCFSSSPTSNAKSMSRPIGGFCRTRAAPPRDPDGPRGGYSATRSPSSLPVRPCRAHDLLGHRVGIFEGEHVAAARAA